MATKTFIRTTYVYIEPADDYVQYLEQDTIDDPRSNCFGRDYSLHFCEQGGMETAGWILLTQFDNEMVVVIEDGFNLKPLQVAALRRELDAEQDKYHRAIAPLKEQMSKLLALDAPKPVRDDDVLAKVQD